MMRWMTISLAAWLLFAAAPSDAQQPQPAPAADPASPALADIMTGTQLRHLKLAYSGKVVNWPLADYELGRNSAKL
jgi:hypothetical protein